MHINVHKVDMASPSDVSGLATLIDTGAVDIDGENVLQTTQPNTDTTATVTLTQGWHPIEVRHQDLTSATRVFLSWSPPGVNERLIIGRDYYCPALNLCAEPPLPLPN